MLLRYAGLIAVVALAGCVVEQPRPRPVIVEHPVVQREYVQEVIAPQPPPERIVEVEPAYRPGYIWARGYWRWDGGRYVAVPGHWEGVRPGYHYVHPHWERHPDGWHWRVGVWAAG